MAISRHRLIRIVAAGGAALLAMIGTARAEGAAVESMFDVAFGVAITSNYVARGITQTDDGPAVQPYVELDAGPFYAGVWGSNVSFGGTPDTEVDLTVGVRPEIDRFAFDFGYAHYLYLSDPGGTGYGEIFGIVDFSATDEITVGGQAYYAPNVALSGTTATYVEANADIALPHDFGLSGALGYQQFDAAFGASYVTWNAGIYWQMNDAVALDLRYTDTNLASADCINLASVASDCAAKVMLSLSIDTSASALGGN